MIACRHWFGASLTAPLRRVWELVAAAPGNTFTPVRASNQPKAVVGKWWFWWLIFASRVLGAKDCRPERHDYNRSHA